MKLMGQFSLFSERAAGSSSRRRQAVGQRRSRPRRALRQPARPPGRDTIDPAARAHRHSVRSRLDRRLQRPDHGEFNDRTVAAIKAFQRAASSRKPAYSIRRNGACCRRRQGEGRRRWAGAWSTIPSPECGSGFRPSRCPARAGPRPAPAGPRRKGRFRSRPSRSGSRAHARDVHEQQQERAPDPQARSQRAASRTSSCCRACRA